MENQTIINYLTGAVALLSLVTLYVKSTGSESFRYVPGIDNTPMHNNTNPQYHG